MLRNRLANAAKPQFVMYWLQGMHYPHKAPGKPRKETVRERYQRRTTFVDSLMLCPTCTVPELVRSGNAVVALTGDHGYVLSDEATKIGVPYGPECVQTLTCTHVPLTFFSTRPLLPQEIQAARSLPFTHQWDVMPTLLAMMKPSFARDPSEYSDGVSLINDAGRSPLTRAARTIGFYSGQMGSASVEPGGIRNGLPILVLVTPEFRISVVPTPTKRHMGFWLYAVRPMASESPDAALLADPRIHHIAETAFAVWLAHAQRWAVLPSLPSGDRVKPMSMRAVA